MRLGLLGLGFMFIIITSLKIAGVTTISWWLVSAPLWWIPVLFFVSVLSVHVLALVAVIVTYTLSAVEKVASRMVGIFRRN